MRLTPLTKYLAGLKLLDPISDQATPLEWLLPTTRYLVSEAGCKIRQEERTASRGRVEHPDVPRRNPAQSLATSQQKLIPPYRNRP